MAALLLGAAATGSARGQAETGASSAFDPGFSGDSGSGAASSFQVFSSEAPADAAPAPSTPAFSTPAFGFSQPPAQETPSFSLPGFYGQGGALLIGGNGRLAKPRFEAALSFSLGYDDNIFQTPSDDTPGIIPGVARVVDEGDPGGQPIVERRTIIDDGGLVREVDVVVGFTPGRPPEIVLEDVEIPAAERRGSFVTRSTLGLQMQRFNRRSVFTLDGSFGRTYFWDKSKDEDPVDYNASLSAAYVYRFTPRLQLSAQLNSVYYTQPDFTRINTPDQPTRGDVMSTLARTDLNYRFTPRFSLRTTASYSGLRFTDEIENTARYDDFTFGLEARYLWKPRWTLLAEYRRSMIDYPEREILNSSTDFLLLGAEFQINPRLGGSLRMGQSRRQFELGGDAQVAPYVESSVTYRSTARSSINWFQRFGFEESLSPDEERLVYRSTINYSYLFTSRFRGAVSATFVHEISENDVAGTKFAQDTFDSSLSFDYRLTRRFSLNANYNFTMTNSNTGISDFYRNRVFFGGSYEF
jgi:hypothetical protein